LQAPEFVLGSFLPFFELLVLVAFIFRIMGRSGESSAISLLMTFQLGSLILDVLFRNGRSDFR
jgi:uncharacterized membrane protein YcaP (DUF421 family)